MPPLPTALADIPNGAVTSPRGFTAAAAHAGLKADGAPDVALLVGATSCATAGVFTKNALRAAPVVYDADLLAERPGRMRAVAMNARVANACTGAPGLAAARAMAQAAEQAAGLPPRTALVLSTGVIGAPDRLAQGPGTGPRDLPTRRGAAPGALAAESAGRLGGQHGLAAGAVAAVAGGGGTWTLATRTRIRWRTACDGSTPDAPPASS